LYNSPKEYAIILKFALINLSYARDEPEDIPYAAGDDEEEAFED